MRKNLFSWVLSIALGAAVLTACGSTASEQGGTETGQEGTASSEKQELTIRLCYLDLPSYVTQFAIAKELGYFDDAFEHYTVNFEYTYFSTGSSVNEAFAAGEIDVVTGSGDFPTVNGLASGLDLVVVARNRLSTSGGVVAAADSGITSVGDLKGKTAAVALGTVVHKIADLHLGDYGLTEADLEYVNLASGADIVAAFEKGEIDAAFCTASALLAVEDAGVGYSIADNTNHPAYAYIEFTRAFTETYPDVVEELLGALYKASIYYSENIDEGNQLLADFLGISLEDVLAQMDYDTTDFSLNLNQESIDNLEQTFQFLKDNDMLSQDIDSIENYYDDTFINHVISNYAE